jgi:hypothetical protein
MMIDGGPVTAGPITAGHGVVWVAPNILGDSGSVVASGALPTRTPLLSGSGTYNTPPGCRRLFIRMVGGGGSGQGASPDAFGNAGNPGTATVFGPTTANPGAGGASYSYRIGGSGGAGPASLRIAGGSSGGGGIYAGANPIQTQITGIYGGNSAFGGAGAGPVGESTPGSPGATNSGSGGAGGVYCDSHGGGAHTCWGGAGSAGEYVEIIINAPAASYAYTVGQGGVGGTGTSNGGNGGSGVIIIDEYY